MAEDVRTEFTRAAALHRQGQLHEAIDIYRRLLKRRPGLFEVERLLVFAQLQAGRVKQAHAAARKARQAHRDNPHAHVLYGATLQAERKFADALAAFEQACSLDPGLAEAQYLAGNMLASLERHAEAAIRFSRVIELDPRAVEAVANRAAALVRLDRRSEALEDLARLCQLQPWDPAHQLARGALLLDLDRPAEALAAAEVAIALRSGLADGHYLKGRALLASGDADAARSAFRTALALAPDRPAFKAALAGLEHGQAAPAGIAAAAGGTAAGGTAAGGTAAGNGSASEPPSPGPAAADLADARSAPVVALPDEPLAPAVVVTMAMPDAGSEPAPADAAPVADLADAPPAPAAAQPDESSAPAVVATTAMPDAGSHDAPDDAASVADLADAPPAPAAALADETAEPAEPAVRVSVPDLQAPASEVAFSGAVRPEETGAGEDLRDPASAATSEAPVAPVAEAEEGAPAPIPASGAAEPALAVDAPAQEPAAPPEPPAAPEPAAALAPKAPADASESAPAACPTAPAADPVAPAPEPAATAPAHPAPDIPSPPPPAAPAAAEPDDPDAVLRRAFEDLADGRWHAGWAGLDSIAAAPDAALPFARWDGVSGASTLVVTGGGDVRELILFARLLRLLADRGLPARLLADARTVELLSRIDARVPVTEDLAGVDVRDRGLRWLPLASLPRLIAPDPAFWPRAPFLTADPARIARWRHVRSGGFMVGLSWGGDAAILAACAGLAEMEGVDLVALDYGPLAEEQLAAQPFGARVARIGPPWGRGDDLSDIAAVLQHLDLVVTGDGPVAHLAGARGRPAVVMLADDAHWCWGRAGAASPFYPALDLMRADAGTDATARAQARAHAIHAAIAARRGTRA